MTPHASPGTGPPATARPLTTGEHTAVIVTGAVTGVLGLLGFVNSFDSVRAAAEPSFGPLAWTVPLGIDLGIAVFSALDIVLARLGMRVRWLRFIPWALTGATVYLNIAAYLSADPIDWIAVVAHAVLPLLWVVAVEVGAHVIRKRADLAKADRMDGIRRSRWLLAPAATFALWRRMVLWEIRSYPDALARERTRVLAKTDLQDRYGRLWRFKATRRERALYRLGELTPAGAPIHIEAERLPGPPGTAARTPPTPHRHPRQIRQAHPAPGRGRVDAAGVDDRRRLRRPRRGAHPRSAHHRRARERTVHLFGSRLGAFGAAEDRGACRPCRQPTHRHPGRKPLMTASNPPTPEPARRERSEPPTVYVIDECHELFSGHTARSLIGARPGQGKNAAIRKAIAELMTAHPDGVILPATDLKAAPTTEESPS
ncbi:DUF2637 domain-containing protein [Nonomuraea typhae]|uniref:DUF2637 domain-containing protein n=1 Tax=Nonomuraea typhae TaxID=2603600 RepID=UPI0015E20746|nr:DUF2637 domain-containing protein [Nonomuraea typhae]